MLMEATTETVFSLTILEKTYAISSVTAVEGLSMPYRIDLTMIAHQPLDLKQLVGQPSALTLEGADTPRFFHGLIRTLRYVKEEDADLIYQCRIVPSLDLLSLRRDSRIFQEMTVPQIVTQVLQGVHIDTSRHKFRLQRKHAPRNYCVQYRESDLAFISRLLEEEGIFYFFEHSADNHLLVFGDSPVNYQAIARDGPLPFLPDSGMVADDDAVTRLEIARHIHSGRVSLDDYNFEKPTMDLACLESCDCFDHLALFDCPGEFTTPKQGRTLSAIRLEEALAEREMTQGSGTCHLLAPGFTFTLEGHPQPDLDRDYLLVRVHHKGRQIQAGTERTRTRSGYHYTNTFTAIPADTPFRPPRKTPRARVSGPQTAMVVGPQNEEIYTDKYGRVKVKFHWDRYGHEAPEKSSCWIRVIQSLAGGRFGSMFLPRVGQEVVVDFLEGDPDRPLVTGCVYNGDHMPPYPLPEGKTVAGLKTKTVDDQGFNEIRFQDAAAEEELYIHAQKDLNQYVENDRAEYAGNDHHVAVKRDRIEQVDRDRHARSGRDDIRQVGRDCHLQVKGLQAVDVTGTRSLTVKGDVTDLFQKDHCHQVGGDYYLKGMNLVIESMTGLTLKTGSNFITIDPAGIAIKGTMVDINSGGSALDGVAITPVSPTPPLEPLIPDVGASGKATKVPAATALSTATVPAQSSEEQKARSAPTYMPPPEDEEEDQAKTNIRIKLVDEDDQPVTGEKYMITLPDGKTVATGVTNNKGMAEVTGIDPGTCKVSFPRLDANAWEKI